MIIGITGGIGSGKSTIARALAARGYAVYDCDREAKRIIAENKDVQQQIIALLGPEAFVNGVYNTSYVAQRVFAEPELLERLNQIVHPAVKADIIRHSPLSFSMNPAWTPSATRFLSSKPRKTSVSRVPSHAITTATPPPRI